jgi:(1->4)-alpha-D-glucan 1-alpha-D-glucosylmutase
VGSWPVEGDTDPPYLERLEKYIVKFLREAKLNSTWHSPNEEYEAGVISFVQGILEQSDLENPFYAGFSPILP